VTSLLEAVDLVKHFQVKGDVPFAAKTVHAVDGISFSVETDRSVGIVGESGSGKTTIARCLVRLYRPTSGSVLLEGKSISSRAGVRQLRRRVQMVFQDPGGSLNPKFTAERIIRESLLHLKVARRRDMRSLAIELLRQVGIQPSDSRKLPHQFSGGQQQRIAVARALAPKPDVLILDEPTSALDLSLQAQIIGMLVGLRKELGLTYALITHDLAVVRQLCDELLVMYLGKPVESGPAPRILSVPQHPYSRALIGSVLRPDPSSRDLTAPLRGEIPSPTAPPPGCRFHPRCPNCMPMCRGVEPKPQTVGDVSVWCHLFAEARGLEVPAAAGQEEEK
jgi:oligopeptide/dipeptide ABC transporter ATP-binding protein